MKTNKPKVVGYIDEQEFSQRVGHAPFLHPTPNRGYMVPLIRLSDYESLQAECERVRGMLFQCEKDRDQYEREAERYRWLRADALSAYEDDLDEPQLVYARECVGDYQDCIDAAIDAAMQEQQP